MMTQLGETLGEILRQAEINAYDTAPAINADAQAEQIRSRPQAMFTRDRPADLTLQEIATASRMPLNPEWRHLEIIDTIGRRRGMAALHAINGTGDAELVFVGASGAITRKVVKEIAAWAFFDNGLRRLTARIRSDFPEVRDYARRLGFVFEGCQRDYFGAGVHAYLWAISREQAGMRYLDMLPHHWERPHG